VIVDLLIGLPAQRPGGILLTVLIGAGAASGALLLGIIYATACVRLPWLSLGLQVPLAVARGIPLILLIFAIGQLTTLPLVLTGYLALLLYSLCHVGETLRGFMNSYPRALSDQARVLGYGGLRDWVLLRLPWTLRSSLDALATHWISLLKDTGALTVLSIGELTTVASTLSQTSDVTHWELIISLAGLIYLSTAVILIQSLELLRRKLPAPESMAT
jgi:ABC-type amino acid transport system permease subunit